MKFYSIALMSEAMPLIDKYNLQKTNDKSFKIFSNHDIKLIITGIGSINSAIATTYLLTKYQAKKNDKAINIGIAGANFKCEIGDIFRVNRVIDYPTKSILSFKNEGKKLTTMPTPTVECDIKNTLVDMEGYGFAKSATKFIHKENVMIYKIVSDFLDTDIPPAQKVENLINNIMNTKENYEQF